MKMDRKDDMFDPYDLEFEDFVTVRTTKVELLSTKREGSLERKEGSFVNRTKSTDESLCRFCKEDLSVCDCEDERDNIREEEKEEKCQ